MKASSVYKSLLRTVEQVFKNDLRQSEIKEIIKKKFKSIDDLSLGIEVEKVLRENICQGIKVKDAYRLEIRRSNLRDNKI